jgi:uncharacterized phage protein (TIGR02218 family)
MAVISINSHIEQYKRPMPRNVWGPHCRHTLFDAGCALDRTNFQSGGSVTGVVSNARFAISIVYLFDYFSLGYITWLSGKNVGFSRTIRSYDGVTVVLIAPMPFAVQVGDTFHIYPGCDKTLATCTNKFANQGNFGGQPYIPAPESAL